MATTQSPSSYSAATLRGYLDIRSNDNRWFDIDCSDLLDAAETIVSFSAPAEDPGGPGLTYGTPVVNQAPISYPLLGRVAQIGKALQMKVQGAVLAAGVPSQLATCRIVLTTQNDVIEADIVFRLINTPP